MVASSTWQLQLRNPGRECSAGTPNAVMLASNVSALDITIHGEGLPQQDAYHLVYRHALAVSGDGNTLAMGSTTGGLWVSGDAGDTWYCISRDLPPIAVVRLD